MSLDPEVVRLAVARALEEDLGPRGDITSDAVIPAGRRARARIVARSALVLAGIDVAREVFRQLDPAIDFRAFRADGDLVEAGECVAQVSGAARLILRGERTALNFLMRACGIARAARRAVEEVAGTGATILDTRKTAPGLRHLDKHAVAAGGATNHRIGLWDAAMIKDTHLGAAPSIPAAVRRVRASGCPPEKITVEVRSTAALEEAITAGAGRALLDNMSLDEMRAAVAIGKGRIVLEASGGLRPGELRRVAETGVDCLSLGWLTHSAPAADLAMEMEAEAS